MAEIARRWRVLWMGEGVCAALSFLGVAFFALSPKFGQAVLGHRWLVLAWIALLISPLLWLEFAVSWALAGTNERWIRAGGALVFPALVVAVALLLRANPSSFDQVSQPAGWIWIVCVGMRVAHLWAVTQAAKQD